MCCSALQQGDRQGLLSPLVTQCSAPPLSPPMVVVNGGGGSPAANEFSSLVHSAVLRNLQRLRGMSKIFLFPLLSLLPHTGICGILGFWKTWSGNFMKHFRDVPYFLKINSEAFLPFLKHFGNSHCLDHFKSAQRALNSICLLNQALDINSNILNTG